MVSIEIATAPSDEHLVEGDAVKVETADIAIAPSDEHLEEDVASIVETAVEDDCDFPVHVDERRDPSPAALQETAEKSTDAPVTPSSNSNWFRRDGGETKKPPSRSFWFARPEQGALNRATLKDLDENAKRNEEIGTSRQNTPWWTAEGTVAQPINEEQMKTLNDFHREYRTGSLTPQRGKQSETAIVVRSEPVNVFWDVISRAIRQTALWRTATKIQESSKNAAEQRSKKGAAMRHGLRKFFSKRNTAEEANIVEDKEVAASRRPWWRRFRRNRSGQPQADGQTSTAVVRYEAGPHPFAAAMRKAAAGATGACMVIVGIPLLLFPVPGPGVAMIASGVYVVSTEFEFARSWLETVKTRYGTVFDRLGIEVATPEVLPAPSLPIEDADAVIKASDEDETDDHKKVGCDETEEDLTLLAADGDKDRKDSSNESEAMTMRI